MICIIHSSFRLQYEAEYQLVRCQWQCAHNEDFRPALDTLLQFIKDKHAVRCMIDLRGLPDIGFDDQSWLTTAWLPRVMAQPIQQLALVFSPTLLYNQLVVENLLLHGQPFLRFETQFFNDQLESLDWLTSASPRISEIEQEWQLVYVACTEQQARLDIAAYREALLCQTGSQPGVEQLLSSSAG